MKRIDNLIGLHLTSRSFEVTFGNFMNYFLKRIESMDFESIGKIFNRFHKLFITAGQKRDLIQSRGSRIFE